MKIIIPSMSRADAIITHKLLNDYLVCVPESQLPEYEQVIGKNFLLGHPDKIKGKPAKLNWCFDHVPYDDGIVFIDDDIDSIVRTFSPRDGSPSQVREPSLVHGLIENTARVAHDINAFFFGWAVSARDRQFFTGFRPFAMTGYINGTFMGFLKGHGLRFDERFVGKADYDISCQNAMKHRYCVRDMRYSVATFTTFRQSGGSSHYRTTETEQRDIALLRRKWGKVIKIVQPSINRRSRENVDTISLALPF
jgi:hypothetical protein